MKHVTASLLALGLAASIGPVSAQTYFNDSGRYDDRYDTRDDGRYDTRRDFRSSEADYAYARVLSVHPVMDGGAYPTGNASQRCYQRRDSYARDDGYGDGRDGGYRDGGYRNDGYNDGYRGTTTGRTVATVVGGIVGAALGSQVGGGSARYATSAIGSMVGGIAGQQVYENSVRSRSRDSGLVTVCDPVTDDRYGDAGTRGSGVNAYDVTYEYGGRTYTSRTNYHPGDRIRVRVDVHPD